MVRKSHYRQADHCASPGRFGSGLRPIDLCEACQRNGMHAFLLGEDCELRGERRPSHVSTYSLNIGTISAVYK